MKKAKRILAVLLADVLAFTILTGCGGGTGTYKVSATVKSSVASVLQQAGFSPSVDEKALNAISAEYAAQIAKSPKSYAPGSSSSLSSSLQKNWRNACIDAFTVAAKQALWGTIPGSGIKTEADAASYYTNQMSYIISSFNDTFSTSSGTTYYYIYPVYAESSTDPDNSVWMLFIVLYIA